MIGSLHIAFGSEMLKEDDWVDVGMPMTADSCSVVRLRAITDRFRRY